MPLVSIIMSVYNGGEYVGEAIESILNQTFENFEFIIINDGSTDNSLDILEKYRQKDKRIKIITQDNKGLTKSLNIGIKSSTGKYIARQDADDLSFPERIENQVNTFENDSSLVLLGTRAKINFKGFIYESPSFTDAEINNKLKRNNVFVHSSVMYRSCSFINIGMYNELFKFSQDYEAWIRLSEAGKLSILDNFLVERTIQKNSISYKKLFLQCYNAYNIRRSHIPLKLNIYTSLYQLISSFCPAWLIRIVKQS